MSRQTYTAWDIGGAHLKAAKIDQQGQLLAVAQQPCPLWKGLDHLTDAMQTLNRQLGLLEGRQAITMTGELSDLFASRIEGVDQILNTVNEELAGAELRVFAGRQGLLGLTQARQQALAIASANWLATAQYVAGRVDECLLVDIGSTTTDILSIRSGQPAVEAFDDAGRLRTEELVYCGVSRTPVMAIAQRVAFNGQWYSLAAEHFATCADIYRLCGDLRVAEDMADTADGQGKTVEESARRLARMLGMDYEHASPQQWQTLAHHLAGQQQYRLSQSIQKALSHPDCRPDSPIVGAGAGRFLVRTIAGQLNRPYLDISSLFNLADQDPNMAAVCAPAVSLACLSRSAA